MITESYCEVLCDFRTLSLFVLNNLNDDERSHFCRNIKTLLTEYELANLSKEK